MSDAATNYRTSGQRLDEHTRSCTACASGSECPVGDDTAEAEFRAWRAWERDDAQAAHEHRRRGLPC